MNRNDAKKIAETISNEDLALMFERAKDAIDDWTVVSICNKGMTKGLAWNILARDFDVNGTNSILAKTNMIREFGAFLTENIKIKKIKKVEAKPPIHQDPIFNTKTI